MAFFCSIIKVFSSFLFARHNTKVPFYFSLVSVALNAFISIYFFNRIGFIIIPIATTISSWVNALLLFIFLNSKKYYSFNSLFLSIFPRIILSTFLMGYIFNYLIIFFGEKLTYYNEYKLVYLILIVLFAFIIYIVISFLTKAFKISDIKLRY